MPEMISKVAHIYAGRQLSAGERFHADKAFVPALIGLGRAEPAPAQSRAVKIQMQDVVAAEPAVYPTRDVVAVDPAVYPTREMAAPVPTAGSTRDVPLTARQKRKYARRQSA